MSDLNNIKYIGGTIAQRLAEAGFKTADDLAQSTPKKLSKVNGVGAKSAELIIQAAKDFLAENQPVAEVVETPAPTVESEADKEARKEQEAKAFKKAMKKAAKKAAKKKMAKKEAIKQETKKKKKKSKKKKKD